MPYVVCNFKDICTDSDICTHARLHYAAWGCNVNNDNCLSGLLRIKCVEISFSDYSDKKEDGEKGEETKKRMSFLITKDGCYGT
jgi:hypothetical protein